GGLPVIILTTTGARSGNTRKNPIMRVEQDCVYAAIASYAGGPENPRWYYNLLAHPYATIQDGPQIRRVRAREVVDEEKQGWWAVAPAPPPPATSPPWPSSRPSGPTRSADRAGAAAETGPAAVIAVVFVADYAH